MKITLDIPDGIIAGFFNGVEVTAHGTMFLTRSEPRRTTGMVRTWFLTTSRQSSLQTTP